LWENARVTVAFERVGESRVVGSDKLPERQSFGIIWFVALVHSVTRLGWIDLGSGNILDGVDLLYILRRTVIYLLGWYQVQSGWPELQTESKRVGSRIFL
jgi:hypothetical protein